MRIRNKVLTVLCMAAIACGRSSPTATVAKPVDVTGNWSGTIASARAGNGTLLIVLNQRCLVLLSPGAGCEGDLDGKWTTIFANPAYSDSGTVSGTVQDSTTQFSLNRRDANICPLLVSAMANRTSMNGRFGGQVCSATMTSPPADSGTVSLLKVEGVISR